ncbi:MAG: alpha/beta hydrolase, partial [Terrimicrobiaceae bacterium]|nr:alpha/beta hydrolase [Terrimicrobiaceae bacterium]
MIEPLCLLVALGLFGFSALAVVRAPTLPLVFLSVGATELGHWFAMGALGLAIVAPRESPAGVSATALAVLSAGLLLTPAIRAALAAPRIRRELDAAFGTDRAIFRLRDLFRPHVSHRPVCERLMIEGPGGPLGIDLYAARTPTAAPLVVIAHGGGWMAGSSHELAGWNRWLAARGYAVAAVDYRLVPNGVWPDQRDDLLAAIDFLRADPARFGIDPDRVVLLGRSAGGQIASAIAAGG